MVVAEEERMLEMTLIGSRAESMICGGRCREISQSILGFGESDIGSFRGGGSEGGRVFRFSELKWTERADGQFDDGDKC